MPKIARTFIKTGLIYFICALLLALGYELQWLHFSGAMPLFWHMLMVGWITQIIFGVSMWMFPGRKKEEGFNAQRWAWLTFILLNSGLILRVLAEPFVNTSPLVVWDWLILISALTQVLAAVCYIIELWPRIQSKKQRHENHRKKRAKRGKSSHGS